MEELKKPIEALIDQLNKLQRLDYNITSYGDDGCSGEEEEWELGKYVRWDDIKAIINQHSQSENK